MGAPSQKKEERGLWFFFFFFLSLIKTHLTYNHHLVFYGWWTVEQAQAELSRMLGGWKDERGAILSIMGRASVIRMWGSQLSSMCFTSLYPTSVLQGTSRIFPPHERWIFAFFQIVAQPVWRCRIKGLVLERWSKMKMISPFRVAFSSLLCSILIWASLM